jgi:hypothetical protein
MGVVIGSAVAPLWFMMTWNKASGTGAVLAAWGGLATWSNFFGYLRCKFRSGTSHGRLSWNQRSHALWKSRRHFFLCLHPLLLVSLR